MLPVYPHVGLIIGYSGWGVHRYPLHRALGFASNWCIRLSLGRMLLLKDWCACIWSMLKQ